MIFIYKDLTLERQHGENFDVMHFSFIDYNQQIREVNLVWSSIGRKTIWLAQFSGFTTEYSGDLSTVLEEVYKHYQSNSYKPKELK